MQNLKCSGGEESTLMASRAFEHVVLFTVATSVREEETDEGQIVLLAWLILSTSKNQVSTN